MKLLDLTFLSPAENLACDEALLDAAEAGAGGEVLRFWESLEPFVVVGYANKVSAEVNVAACEARGIPILRRCSGGGTVLQGPGCLNYTLILKITEGGPLGNIGCANEVILEQNRVAILSLLPNSGVSIHGHTDLCFGHLKFSGNSQRRRKHYLLFHGTFLLNLDLALVGDLLRMPSKQPDYRGDRAHDDFLMNLNVSAEKVRTALQRTWNVSGRLNEPPLEKAAALALEKYSTRDWNFKF